MSPQAVIEALFSRLTANQQTGSFHNLVGGRIFHAQAQHDAALPHLVYTLIDNQPTRYFGGRITWRMSLRFELWVDVDSGGAGSSGGGTLEELLFAEIDDVELTVTGGDRGVLLFAGRGVPSIIEDAILIVSDFDIVGTTEQVVT